MNITNATRAVAGTMVPTTLLKVLARTSTPQLMERAADSGQDEHDDEGITTLLYLLACISIMAAIISLLLVFTCTCLRRRGADPDRDPVLPGFSRARVRGLSVPLQEMPRPQDRMAASTPSRPPLGFVAEKI